MSKYEETLANGIEVKGYYNNGVRTGLWRYHKGNALVKQGFYSMEGFKFGNWANRDVEGVTISTLHYNLENYMLTYYNQIGKICHEEECKWK